MTAVWLIVPAAGVGSRMQSAIAKQYLPLAGKTVIEHTLERLLQIPQVQGAIIALNPNDVRFRELPVATDPRVTTVDGGKERADSVRKALEEILPQAKPGDWALVHDAARPCVRNEVLNSFVAQTCAFNSGDAGAILAAPVADTVKRVDNSEAVLATLDRTGLWAAQTPQMFRVAQLHAALTRAQSEGLAVTDEASAMEAAGHRVRVIQGPSDNVKITRPEDLPLAELILQSQERL